MNLSKLKFIIVTSITLFFGFLLINQSFACGPFYPRYFYTPEDIENLKNPLFFIDESSFFNSNYEIISSNWRPQFLYPVYRDLINNRLTEQEKEQLYRYYKGKFYDIYKQWDDAVASWKEARKLVTKEDIKIGKFKCENYNCYINCLPDAFLTAVNALRERIKIYNNEELKIWLEGQDKVFSNCGNPESVGFIPLALAASVQQSSGSQSFFTKVEKFFVGIFKKITEVFKKLFVKKLAKPEERMSILRRITNHDLLKYDQEYQTASAYFYEGNFDEAEKRFKEIVNNKEHPWRAYAALALGRTYIRKGQFEYEKAIRARLGMETALRIQNEQFEKAKTQFKDILKDSSLSSVHEGAKSLLNLVNFRLDPEKRFKESEDVLLTSHNPEEIVRNLEDFSLLFENKIKKEYIFEKGRDLSQWIYIWKNLDQNDLEFALQKYQQTKSLPWLLVSLKLMALYHPDHPLRNQIISESLKIPNDSPAYLTANYYRLKLLIKTGEDTEKIKRSIDNILKTIHNEFPSAKNYFSELRMMIAESLRESLSYSWRKAVAVQTDGIYRVSKEEEIYLIDPKIEKLFNEFLPLKKWVEIVSTKEIFPYEITKQMRLITFVRSVLLDDFKTAKNIADLLSSADSMLKKDLSDFLKAKDYDEKRFTAALFILKYPRLNTILDERLAKDISVKERDEFRENWWCEYPSEGGDKSYDINDLKKFVSSEEIQEARLENDKIYRITAPNYLSEIVINYAIKNPKDPRVPEALHLAIMSTRFARCKDERTSEFSQRAFQILHNNYPNNYWTKQTPYWY